MSPFRIFYYKGCYTVISSSSPSACKITITTNVTSKLANCLLKKLGRRFTFTRRSYISAAYWLCLLMRHEWLQHQGYIFLENKLGHMQDENHIREITCFNSILSTGCWYELARGIKTKPLFTPSSNSSTCPHWQQSSWPVTVQKVS